MATNKKTRTVYTIRYIGQFGETRDYESESKQEVEDFVTKNLGEKYKTRIKETIYNIEDLSTFN